MAFEVQCKFPKLCALSLFRHDNVRGLCDLKPGGPGWHAKREAASRRLWFSRLLSFRFGRFEMLSVFTPHLCLTSPVQSEGAPEGKLGAVCHAGRLYATPGGQSAEPILPDNKSGSGIAAKRLASGLRRGPLAQPAHPTRIAPQLE